MKLPKISQRAVLFIAFALSTCALLLSLGLVRYRPAKPTEPTGIIGASANYAYPVGPAGGSLSGTYPNPSVTSCGSCSYPDSGGDAPQDATELLAYNPQTGTTFSSSPGDLAYFDAWHVAQLGGNPVAQFVDAEANGCLTPSGANKCVLELIDGSIGLGNPICTNACSASAGTRAYYGSGVDGAVHLTTLTTTFAGGSCTSGTCALTRTAAYTDLTIDVGVTLSVAGSGIYGTGTLALAGAVTADGASASGSTGGAGASHLFYGGGSNGGNGDSGGGVSAGVTFANNVGLGGAGGAGGNTAGGGGSAGGAGGGLNNGIGIVPQSIPSVDYLSGVSPGIGDPTSLPGPTGLYGGTGGGGGAANIGSGGSTGGGGGGGGGVIVISFAVRTGAGAIHTRGGAGAPGANAGATGGGGGGGLIIDICGDKSAYTGTIDEGGGAGANAGANGQYLYIQGMLDLPANDNDDAEVRVA